jgi:hypothetical protein
MEVGDVFSETSHYKYEGKQGENYQFTHLESKQTINLDKKYVSQLLVTADQYSAEMNVGKEDKLWTDAQITAAVTKGELVATHKVRAGDVRVPGIRSIWNDIHSSDVFTVVYDKQGKDLSDKKYQEALAEQMRQALAIIEKAKANKKSTAEASTAALQYVQSNPVQRHEAGEERELRGYKIQFDSITGFYDVIDMDITDSFNVRQVNVNTIKSLVFKGVKYTVV